MPVLHGVERDVQPQDVQFSALFAARAGVVRRTAYLLCGSWHQAEDLAQTAFTKLYAAWPRLRDQQAAEAFLRTTLTRVYLDAARRSWRREEPTAEPPGVESPATASDERLVLTAALAQLPPRQRACLVLRYFDDCSVEDTAQALRCSTGTVKSNTSRGLDALRRVLGDTLAPSGRDLA